MKSITHVLAIACGAVLRKIAGASAHASFANLRPAIASCASAFAP